MLNGDEKNKIDRVQEVMKVKRIPKREKPPLERLRRRRTDRVERDLWRVWEETTKKANDRWREIERVSDCGKTAKYGLD